MKESLSIDEIIRQAEEIRKKTAIKAQSAMDEITSGAQELTQREIDVPKLDPESIVIEPVKKHEDEPAEDDDIKIAPERKFVSQKTAVVEPSAVKEAAEDKNRINDKTRPVRLSEKTSVVPDIKKAENKKKSFFNSDKEYEPVYSKQPPEIIEKPATIKGRSKFDKILDLEEVPTIVAVDELAKTRISFNRAEEQDAVEEEEEYAQIVLDGFEDSTEEVSKIDETVAEQQLEERRRDKVNKFRLFSPDDYDENKVSNSSVKRDFEDTDDRNQFLDYLYNSKKSVSISLIITAVLTIAIGALTALEDTSYLPTFLMDTTPFLITLAVLLAAVILVNFKGFIRGFKFKTGINSDFPVSVAAVIVLVHTILLIVDNDLLIDDGSPYPFAAALAFLLALGGKYALINRIIYNFKFLITKTDKYTVETVVNQVDAAIISRGVLTGDTNLKTSIKTDFPTKFMDISCSEEPADGIAKVMGLLMLALNVVIFVVFSILNQSWHIGLNIAVCGLCISVPCISLLCTNTSLYDLSKALKRNGAMINGFEGANAVCDANAIVIEAQDLFGANSCEIHGIKTFNGAKADDVILKTAAVIINTKSPLASVFDDVIIGKQTILPDVDGIVYEDRLGTSAWIYRKKILVGTRELLIHHGVAVPKEEFEQKYTRKGRKILYLAVTGKLMAMFVVSYNADPTLKKALRRLEKSGITILVKSADPFVNDESIAQLFNLPDGYVRVMNSSNGRVFDKYSNMCAEKSPAYVVHNGSALSFVSAMSGVENIVETRKILSVIISFGCALGFGVVTLLGAVGGFSQLNAISVVVFQLAWCAFTQIVAKIKHFNV